MAADLHEHRSALDLTPLQQRVFDALVAEPTHPKAIAYKAQLKVEQVRSALLYLSAKNVATRTSEGLWRRRTERPCAWCGEAIGKHLRADALFCCSDHRKAAQKARKEAREAHV